MNMLLSTPAGRASPSKYVLGFEDGGDCQPVDNEKINLNC